MVFLAGPLACFMLLAPATIQGGPSAGDAPPPGTSAPPSSPWPSLLEDLRVFGDMRLRHESSVDLGSASDRHRQVMRLRLGFNYRIDDRTEVAARMATGDPADPNTTHVTFGDGLQGFRVSLDRAYLTYRPESWVGSELRGGKFSHPFYANQVYGELLWDADVQPEGMFVRKSFDDLSLLDSIDTTLAVYALEEQRAGQDAGLIAAEIASGARLGQGWQSRFAVAYYGYTRVSPEGSTLLLDSNRGNATVDDDMDGNPDRFQSDFGVLDLNAGFTYTGLSQPLTFSTEVIQNTRARSRGDGLAAGVSYGRSARAGDWMAYYQFQRIEQDSIFSAFAQDDFLLATNHISQLVGVNYQLSDDVGLLVWGLFSDPLVAAPGDPSSPWRIRFELNIKF